MSNGIYLGPLRDMWKDVADWSKDPKTQLLGPNGQPITTSNRLPVDVGGQVATEVTLTQAVDRLNAILTRLEGTLDVNVGGQIHADVDLGDVTVDIGEVQQGARGVNAEPWEVQLTGQRVATNSIRLSGTVAPKTEETVLETTKHIVIHELTLKIPETSWQDNSFRIATWSGSSFGNWYWMRGGGSLPSIHIFQETAKLSSLWEERHNDVFSLTRELELRGFRLVAINNTEDRDLGLHATVSYSEVG